MFDYYKNFGQLSFYNIRICKNDDSVVEKSLEQISNQSYGNAPGRSVPESIRNYQLFTRNILKFDL